VLTGHDNFPDTYKYEAPEQQFMWEWYTNMTIALEPLMQVPPSNNIGRTKKNGVFAAACYTHCGFTHSYPLLNGMNFYQVFGNFYFDRTSPAEYKLQDTCGLMCNPTCG
jgi:hypothetical protein